MVESVLLDAVAMGVRRGKESFSAPRERRGWRYRREGEAGRSARATTARGRGA